MNNLEWLQFKHPEWKKIEIDYHGDWKKHLEIEKFLQSNCEEKTYEIFCATSYPTPRPKWAQKKVSKYIYVIKEPSISSWVALKWQH